jgi:hypothetical protein
VDFIFLKTNNQLEISSPNGKLITHPLTSGGGFALRYTLDASLADLAKKKIME